MKRAALVRHLRKHGCVLFREGGNHSVFVNRATRRTSAVPRHREIKEGLARHIIKKLSHAADGDEND